MSAEIVSLRRARKNAERKMREAEAETNRRRFGRTKAEKQAGIAAEARAARDLDGHRRENDAQGEEP
jgi:hypothetical protein